MHVINLHKICTIFHSQPLEYDNDNEHDDDDDDVDGDDASSRISQLPAKKKRVLGGRENSCLIAF